MVTKTPTMLPRHSRANSVTEATVVKKEDGDSFRKQSIRRRDNLFSVVPPIHLSPTEDAAVKEAEEPQLVCVKSVARPVIVTDKSTS